MTSEAALFVAVRDELSCLWADLQTARRDAHNGTWSTHCDWIVGRIKTLTPLVGPTPWEKLDITLIEDGVYQRVHQELGIDAPYDEEGVRRHHELLSGGRIRSSAGPLRPDEEPEPDA